MRFKRSGGPPAFAANLVALVAGNDVTEEHFRPLAQFPRQSAAARATQ